MIQLVLIYCLTADPKQCVEKRPETEFPLTKGSCMIAAEETAAEYIGRHPEYTLKTWRCEIDKPEEKGA